MYCTYYTSLFLNVLTSTVRDCSADLVLYPHVLRLWRFTTDCKINKRLRGRELESRVQEKLRPEFNWNSDVGSDRNKTVNIVPIDPNGMR